MAAAVAALSITEVKRPRLGEKVPAEVRADLEYTVAALSPLVRAEWDALREHDVVFLLALHGPPPDATPAQLAQLPFVERYGLMAVRGGEVVEQRDESDNVMNEFFARNDKKKGPPGVKRTLKLLLDAAQVCRVWRVAIRARVTC
ncbi:hypothetical protein JKP88DRAFT_172740 [Tribonema minus]|uniref:RNA helicase aquarius beta-barrel domain-containing protein n=1 Tax=Tribonema minus TaxID=303371 RepID=A0A835YK80_9STRA|nr:hypothetical protein JKP88DRAFT_172740 [Tribonema minus]